jgi:hypothetical protein
VKYCLGEACRQIRNRLTYGSGSSGEHLTDAADGFALGFAERKELETVTQTLAVTHDGANSQRIGTEGQRDIKRNNFAGFELAGESRAYAVLSEFGGASPAGTEFAALKHADLETGVDGKAGITANVGGRGRGGSAFLAWSCHILIPGLGALALKHTFFLLGSASEAALFQPPIFASLLSKPLISY